MEVVVVGLIVVVVVVRAAPAGMVRCRPLRADGGGRRLNVTDEADREQRRVVDGGNDDVDLL